MRTLPLLGLTLWLSVLLLFFAFEYSSFIPSHGRTSVPHRMVTNRKVLTGAKFDFRRFLHHTKHHQRHHHHRRHTPVQPEPADGTQIDPRYGVDKRLVPTGPNPLHH
ncbi:hypothetical protein SLEP1_g34596 [Rubroshorea leprosula]|uniref:CLAVATA3/ESR (CLE)-related protein 13 n=1 Tax=Rubroshorea leprosula TaxID=152421 RepID=A0AAV5KKT8_9ROSI|nr:hypothetical protein SLEP1_g34596 [Rubroshorea leprosula]